MQPRPVRRPSTVKYHQPYAPPKEEKEYEEFTVDRSEGYNDHYFEVEDNGRENWEMEGEEGLSEGFEEGRHDAVTERRKRNKFEIFVGGLDRDACEEDLRKVFSQVGEITEVRLMKNPITKKNKGFAFIRFATAEQSRRAVNELKHPVVNGKQCGVAPSQDSDTLFVGNICRAWTKEILKEELVRYGVENFEELTLVEDAKNEGMNRGFAFLDFSSRADALEACKRLQKRDVVFGTDRTARVAFADTFIEPDDEIMSQVRTVFIDGLPSTWDEDRIKEHLKKFGRIEKVELARNMPAAKRNDFGFITFYTHDAAMACIDSINDSEIVSGHKKVKVRARLSRPRQRGKSSKHARGGYPIGQGGDRGVNASWGSSMSHMDTRRFTGHNERSIPSRRVFDDSLKRSLDHRDRHSSGDLVANRTESRRQYPAPDRSFKRRSTASSYEHMRQDESFTRQPPDFSRASIERQSYRDAYLSRRSEYLEDSPISASRVADRRVSPLYDDDDSYGYMENSSRYSDSHIRDYSSISGLKRPYSAIEESYPRYAELSSKQSRARSDYGSSSGLPYTDLYYKSDSRRLVHGSRSDYDGGSQSSAGHSRGLYDRSTSKKISREDTEEMYPKYNRDDESRGYVSSRSNLDSDSYPPIYSNRRMNDGYLGGKDSESYY